MSEPSKLVGLILSHKKVNYINEILDSQGMVPYYRSGMSVSMYVRDENKLCIFFQNWLLQFLCYSYHDERGHQYLSKGEGPMSIDGCPFLGLWPTFSQKLILG